MLFKYFERSDVAKPEENINHFILNFDFHNPISKQTRKVYLLNTEPFYWNEINQNMTFSVR